MTPSMNTTHSTRRHLRVGRRPMAAVTAVALAWSMLLVVTGPSLAAPGTRVNVDPEQGQIAVGSTVILTAEVGDASGSPTVGSDSNTHVRWFFTPPSPNSPNSPGNSPDLQCWTGTFGTCSVSYVAATAGVDHVCAVVSGSVFSCDEEVAAPEWDNHSDTVERVVTTDPTSSPSPTPTP